MTQLDLILKNAVDAIDRRFGADYAKKNPSVLTALLNSATAVAARETDKRDTFITKSA